MDREDATLCRVPWGCRDCVSLIHPVHFRKLNDLLFGGGGSTLNTLPYPSLEFSFLITQRPVEVNHP